MADVTLAPAPTALPPTAPVTRNRPASVWTLRVVVLAYVLVIALLPVVVILYKTFEPGLSTFADALKNHQAVHAFEVSAIVAGFAVVINTVFGIGVGILLARHRFPGKRLLSAFVDLPVAVSPIVVGLALVLVFGPTGWFGSTLKDQIIFAKPGMVMATAFVSLPLTLRAVVPVLEQVGTEQEQAAASLGASAVARFWRITLPTIRTALTYGVVLSIARCLGEYGAVLVVSGNVEGSTETAPLRISNLVQNEQDLKAAYAVTFVLILIAFAAILIAAWIRRRKQT